MEIVNPHYKLSEDNIFEIRKRDYETLIPTIRKILEPAEELGFNLKEFDLKESRTQAGELTKTIKDKLKIIFEKENSEIDLSLIIPRLIDGQYVFINGRKKVPFFQMFDLPIVTRGNSIKFRSNVITAICKEYKEEPYINVSFLNKKVPLALMMFCYYGVDELKDRFDLDNLDDSNLGESMYDKLLYDIKLYYDESSGFTTQDFITELGSYYTKYNINRKGNDTIYAVDLISKADPLTYQFFETDNLLEEIVKAIKDGPYDDTDIRNKRVRFLEYLIISKVSKNIFEFCLANRSPKKYKFNVNQSQILSECNVSDIVQFDFSINPIDELTRLGRVSILGPGGFDRENVPDFLRDINQSMYGRICPVDTPDRDNCGIIQNLIPNVKLDDSYRFSEEMCHQPISMPVSMVPFLEHDDQTRLQMAASQMRQSILLKSFDDPLIKSGCENLYTNYTQFIKRARKNGEISYSDLDYVIVTYDDKDVDVFNVGYRRIYVDNIDIFDIYVSQGDKVKAGDIIAESRYCKNGNINIGKNLLTGVMVHYGNNYEDAIVISDRLVQDGEFKSIHVADLSFYLSPDKVLLSLRDDKYKPLPQFGDRIKLGDPYAITKHIPESPDFEDIFKEPNYHIAEREYFITKSEMYVNTWNQDMPEYKHFIDQKVRAQNDNEDNFKSVIRNILPKEDAEKFIKEEDLTKFSQVGDYKMKKEPINGMLVRLQALYAKDIEVGDKIGNRHGNKGICCVVEHDKMPELEDGRKLDVCINPLGIVSRMNIGQLFELHLGMSVMDLRNELKDLINDGKQKEAKDKLLNYIKIIDNTKDGWYYSQFSSQLPDEIDEEFVNDITIIQPPFESVTLDEVKEAMNLTDTSFSYKVYDPVAEQWLTNEVSVGYMYFFKLIHMAADKMASRSVGSYNRRTMQPLGGRKNVGGQRLGEQEKACLVAYEGTKNLHEFFTVKSDCIDLKDYFIKNKLEAEFTREKEVSEVPESVKLLDSYMKVIGVDMNGKNE